MSARSPLDYDISVAADKRRRARLRGLPGETAAEARKCAQPGCAAPGLFRAPRSPADLYDYQWLCADHVRDFNRAWNYHQGWSEAEIDRQNRRDAGWDRPTWRMNGHTGGGGAHMDGRAWAREGFRDPFEVLGDNATINRGGGAKPGDPSRARLLPKNERSALDILGLGPETPKRDIRTRFRALVRDLHPDRNGGQRGGEKRLRDVIWAWDQIKGSRNFA